MMTYRTTLLALLTLALTFVTGCVGGDTSEEDDRCAHVTGDHIQFAFWNEDSMRCVLICENQYNECREGCVHRETLNTNQDCGVCGRQCYPGASCQYQPARNPAWRGNWECRLM